MDRRHFLCAIATAVPAVAVPRLADAVPADTRTLKFAHLHTAERLDVAYRRGGRYLPSALAAVNHLLRDFRTGDEHAIDPTLLDLLHALHTATGSRKPIAVISAYRSPTTNAMLRSHGGGVASGSLHMQGRAIDIRLADVPLAELRDAALKLRGGGVGYYPSSNFVHVDTGRVRHW